jgi:hypothetical protein
MLCRSLLLLVAVPWLLSSLYGAGLFFHWLVLVVVTGFVVHWLLLLVGAVVVSYLPSWRYEEYLTPKMPVRKLGWKRQ